MQKSVLMTDSSRIRVDRRMAGRVARGAVYIAAAYVLGCCRLFFGTYPLGLALLCAAPGEIIFIFVGLAASALAATESGGALLASYLVAVVLRIFSRLLIDKADISGAATPADKLRSTLSALFGENVYLRMTTAALCAFMAGLWQLARGGYHYYDLFGTLTALAVAPAAVLLLCWFFGGKTGGRYKYIAGAGALVAMLAFAVRDLTIFGISVAAVGGMVCSLCIGRRWGLLCGCAVGFICGICFELTLTPIFVLAVLADRLLGAFSSTLAAVAALCACSLWGLYMQGTDSLTWLLPGLMLGACAYLGTVKAGWLDEPTAPALPEADDPRLTSALTRIAHDEQQLLKLSDGFSSLSRVFYNLSDKLRRPGMLDLRRLCDSVMDTHCPTCPRRDICWGADYNASLDMINKLVAELNEGGRVSPDCLPPGAKTRCQRAEQICEDINAAAGSLTAAVLRSEKMSIFALDYEALSVILSEAVESRRRDYECSDILTERVGEALRELGITPDSLLVYGGRRKYVLARGIDPAEGRLPVERVRRVLGQALECQLDEPLFELCGGSMTMTVTGKPIFRTARAGKCAPAREGEVCGDSICMFDTEKEYFYALISDGMGSGPEAAFCSGLVSVFLENMLGAGNRPDTSIKMLNGVLRSKGGAREMECSATVDLLSVDLLTGEASLLKSGAAPTYVRRGGDIFRLASETVPLGILGAIDAKKTNLQVLAGDVIIMVSDGVSDAEVAVEDDAASECDGWLADLLGYEWEDDLAAMADKIVGRARSRGSRDDVSAVLVRVEEH